MENEIITADLKAEKLIRKFGLLSTEVVKEIISVSIKEPSEEESQYWAEVEQHLLNKLELVRPEHEDIFPQESSKEEYDLINIVDELTIEAYERGVEYDTLFLRGDLFEKMTFLSFCNNIGNVITIKRSFNGKSALMSMDKINGTHFESFNDFTIKEAEWIEQGLVKIIEL